MKYIKDNILVTLSIIFMLIAIPVIFISLVEGEEAIQVKQIVACLYGDQIETPNVKFEIIKCVSDRYCLIIPDYNFEF